MKLAVPDPGRTAAARRIDWESPAHRAPNETTDSRAQPVAQEGSSTSLRAPQAAQRGNRFHLNTLVAQVLFGQVLQQTERLYATSPAGFRLQTGRARRLFSNSFEPLTPIERIRLFEDLLRFANYEGSGPARAFFLAYAPLSFEHDDAGKYIGPGIWTPRTGPRAVAARVRRTLNRWCDWLEALAQFQVHQARNAASPNFPLDKTIILLWPLVQRQQWSCGELYDFLHGLNAELLSRFRTETRLAAYCRKALGLRLVSAEDARPPWRSAGAVARRLFEFLPKVR